MDSTPLISCIRAAIDSLDYLIEHKFGDADDSGDYLQTLRYRFRILKMFVLSTGTFDNDGSLGSLLVNIDGNVRRVAERIHRICLDWDGSLNPFAMSRPLTTSWLLADFLDMIQPSLKEIDEWYLTVFDDDKPRSSSLTVHQIWEIITTFLEGLMDFHALWLCQSDLYKGMEALEEKMTFLNGLIYFAIHRSAEPIKDLMSHVEAVAIRAVYLLFNCRDGRLVVVKPAGITLEMSTFVQKMKLIEDVHQIYAEILLSSKFQSTDVGDSLFALMDVLDYLMSTLWKLLALNTSCAITVKDQLLELFEGLRSLRKILNEQLAVFYSVNMDDVVAVVCNAGIVIFSCSQKYVELSHELQDLLQKLKIILVEFGEEVPQVPILDLPKINQLGFVDFILEKLSEVTNCEVGPSGKSCMQTIQAELLSLRSFLGEIEGLRHTQPELQALWDRILGVAYKVENLIDHVMVDLPCSLTSSCDFVIEDIENIKANVFNTNHAKGGREKELKEVAMTSYQVSSQRIPSTTNEVVGFVKERSSIMERLIGGSKRLRTVTILGMPGVGKTTLAAKMYDDPSVVKYFHIRAWSPVSQEVDKKKILLELINKIDPEIKYLKMTEDDLANKLRQLLLGRRYLVFLDDIWDIKAWYNLKGSFPDGNIGSRIILTSRHFDVVPPDMLDQEPLVVSPLDKEESWKLLQSRLFPENCWTPALHDLGIQIAEKCKGLPLTIVVVAGILATTEPEGWNKVMNALSTGIVSITEHCYNTLELSFKHLPEYLKPCLLYFGAFREDQEVSVRRLLCLWIAEGFVRKPVMKRVQDVAEDYLNALIGRSLLIVSKKRWDGGVKACRIHDLIHDFCSQKAKDDHFFHILKGQDQLFAFNQPQFLRRICIFSEAEHFRESKLFCPRARSLLFNNSWPKEVNFVPQISLSIFIHVFKLLRILDLEGINVGTQFPSELQLLVQLVFLAIRGHMKHIPPLIDKLSNLETFIVRSSGKISLPGSLWNLRKLKYLYMRECSGRFPLEYFESLPILYELDRFSRAAIPLGASLEKLMRKFPGIRELKYTVLEEEDEKRDLYKIVVPDFVDQLHSLHVSSDRLSSYLLIHEICLPTHLKKLALTHFNLSPRSSSIVGELPNLEVLKLYFICFEGNIWEMEEGEFPKLKMLKLYGSKLVEWRGSGDQLAQLQVLLLEACKELEEMPSCLESSSTLETIEVTDCSETVQSLVKRIEEEQESYGNESLRVIIQSRNLITTVHHGVYLTECITSDHY